MPIIREAKQEELGSISELVLSVYSNMRGFPSETQQPQYYEKLKNMAWVVEESSATLLVAVCEQQTLLGCVVYIGDMSLYGSGGIAPLEQSTSGIRLLAVDEKARGAGIGKALTNACIAKAIEAKHQQVILHTTEAMQVAWVMYEKMGFERTMQFDFKQNGFQVYGFCLLINADDTYGR